MPESEVASFLEQEQDYEFEEELLNNPYSVKLWWRYLEAKKAATNQTRNIIHERALKLLPRSYKLWNHYLAERRVQVANLSIANQQFEVVNNAHERALVHLHKMPRIWLRYLEFLRKQKKGTMLRRTFDRALQSLPITQHKRIWKPYLKWVREFGVWETAVRVYRRYLKFNSHGREEYVNYLKELGHFEEASEQLAIIANDDEFVSSEGKTSHQLWMELCEMIATHPEQVSPTLKVEPIIRAGIRKFTDEVGRLWCTLADYYIRLGQFEKARDMYEEAVDTVVTVSDFSMVFDSYSQFEESMLTAKMTLMEEEEAEGGAAAGGDGGEEEEDLDAEGNLQADVDMRLARLEHLMDRRPVLLSSVLLRQNPHNCGEWQKRVDLFKEDPAKQVVTYTEAVQTVDPQQAVGKLHALWINYAKLYEQYGDIDNARTVFEKAVLVNFKHLDDLATLWCEWAEMEIRGDQYDRAKLTLQEAVQPPTRERRMTLKKKSKEEQAKLPSTERVYKSTKVWSLYLDLEESLGSVDDCRNAYERALELKVTTPQMILNYAAFLEENKYFEESFRVYEKGVSAFNFPHAKDIWTNYLTKFVERYGKSKLERARDLFEQCLESVGESTTAVPFFKLYANLEEEHGLVRHAMSIYERATSAVPMEGRMDMFKHYIKKAEQFFGVTKTRDIYSRAVEELPDAQAKTMCLQWATVERKLGEVDRSRALLAHASQFCDPRKDMPFWKRWQDFEVAHGNEETFREMLRIKRSVAARYSQVNYMAAEMLTEGQESGVSDADAMAKAEAERGDSTGGGTKRKADEGGAAETDMEALERQAARIVQATQEAAAASTEAEANPDEISIDEDEDDGGAVAANPDEIDLDDDDDMDLSFKSVPDAVFGDAKKVAAQERAAKEAKGSKEKPKGALARFKSKS